jgi:hypothetical protein
MKKFEITVDAYGPRTSKCFHKVVEAASSDVAYDMADKWCDSLIDEVGNEFDEFYVTGWNEYTVNDHKVGDCWENVIEHDESY